MKHLFTITLVLLLIPAQSEAKRIVKIEQGNVSVIENHVTLFSKNFDNEKDYKKQYPNSTYTHGYKTVGSGYSVASCLIVNDRSWSRYSGEILQISSYNFNNEKVNSIKHNNYFSVDSGILIPNEDQSWGVVLISFEGSITGYFHVSKKCHITSHRLDKPVYHRFHYGYTPNYKYDEISIFGKSMGKSFLQLIISEDGNHKTNVIKSSNKSVKQTD